MRRGVSALAALALLAGCSGSSGGGGAPLPPPDPLAILAEEVRTDVTAEYAIPPNPVTGQAVPAEMRQGVYYRWRLAKGAPVRAILVMIPGTNGGANDFDYMARELIRRSGGQVEVWSVDRRSNLVEDLTGMNAAEEAGDLSVATGYYFGGRAVNGRTFAGFPSGDAISYVSEMGLEALMRDLRAAVAAVPEANRPTNVFIGGHSLGVTQAMTYLGWDFDRDDATTADAGFAQAAGAILLDGNEFHDDFVGFPRDRYVADLARMRDGRAPAIGGFLGLTPEAIALVELAGMAASPAFDDPADPDDGPEGLTPLFGLSVSPATDVLIGALLKADTLEALLGLAPTYKDYKVASRALLGLVFDDDFELVDSLQASVGFLSPPDAPRPRNLLGLPLGGLGLADPAPTYTWLDYDETEGVPGSDPASETTRLARLAEVQWRGPANFTEWYFSNRPNLDLRACRSLANLRETDYQAAEFGLTLFHTAEIDVPILALGAAEGVVREASGYDAIRAAVADPDRSGRPRSDPRSFRAVVYPGFNHLDVLLADDERPGGNAIFADILDFVLANAEGTVVVP